MKPGMQSFLVLAAVGVGVFLALKWLKGQKDKEAAAKAAASTAAPAEAA